MPILGNILDYIKSAIIAVINALLAALGAILEAALALLPDMPDLPDMPGAMETALEWVNWAFPVNTVIAIMLFLAGAWLLWQAVAVAMRWLKLLS